MNNLTKKIISLCLISSLFVLSSVTSHAEEPKKLPELYTHAQAAALIDVASGRIIYSHKGDEELRIASLTKIMTAIVAIEHGKLTELVTVSRNAFGKEGSSIYLKLGEQMTLENLLYGLMLRSGNDAATAIAEHVGGSEEGFVHLMNMKAEELGLEHSHFANPHGLDAEGHYSSANDLAKLTAYAMHNPVFKEIVKTPVKRAPNPNDSWDYKWDNKNKMLRFYDGADGVKTGYTKKAFRCLVSSATRDGQQLVAVTLNDGDDWNDHGKMLDYGFAYYPLQTLIERGQKVKDHPLVAGSTFAYPFGPGEEQGLEKKLSLNAGQARVNGENGVDLSFGLKGRIVLSLNGQTIGEVPVYASGSLLPEPPNSGVKTKDTAAIVQSNSGWASAFSTVLNKLFFKK